MPPEPSSPRGEFAGRRVLVSGAASGIGRCVAERFHAQGADVVGLDLHGGDEETPFRMLAVDLRQPHQIDAVSARLQAECQGLDVLVNAAGILRLGATETLSAREWQECLDVNVSGPFNLLRQWIPTFKRQGRGAVVNVASNAAHVPRVGMTAYCASKAALVSLSHCVALELAPHGVRCNVVSPGSTATPMLAGMCRSPADYQRLVDGLPQQYKLGIPLGKLATPEDIAEAVLYLASDRAGHVTMQDLVVDGGATLGA